MDSPVSALGSTVGFFQDLLVSNATDVIIGQESSSSSGWTDTLLNAVTMASGSGGFDYGGGAGGGEGGDGSGAGAEDGEFYLNLFVLITLISIPIWLTLLPKWLIKLWMTYLIKVKTGKIPATDEEYPEYDWDGRPPVLPHTDGPSIDAMTTAASVLDGDSMVDGNGVEYELLFTYPPLTNGTEEDVPLIMLPDLTGLENGTGNGADFLTNKENVTMPMFMANDTSGGNSTSVPSETLSLQPRFVKEEARKFLVRIQPKDVDYILCVGSLVNERYVLTVAHCIDERAAIHLRSMYQTEILSVAAGPGEAAIRRARRSSRLRTLGGIEKINVPLTAAILPKDYADGKNENQNALGLLRLPQPFSKESNVAPIAMRLVDEPVMNWKNTPVSLASWAYIVENPATGSNNWRNAVKTMPTLLTHRLEGGQCSLEKTLMTCRGLTSSNPFCQAQGLGGLPVVSVDEKTGELQLIGVQVYGDCVDGLFHSLYLPKYKEFISSNVPN